MTDRERLMEIVACSHLFSEIIKPFHWEIIVDYLAINGAEVRPRATWETEGGITTCSICHSPAPVFTTSIPFSNKNMHPRRTDFCPHCGAKMIGAKL